jgi:hypothetical protein
MEMFGRKETGRQYVGRQGPTQETCQFGQLESKPAAKRDKRLAEKNGFKYQNDNAVWRPGDVVLIPQTATAIE